QQHGAVAHHLFRLIAQRFNRRVQCGFGDIKGNVKPVGAVVMLVLSDRNIGKNRLPVPAPMAVGAVQTRLVEQSLRCDANIIV
ncbi:hypothetical protein MJN54_36005, partial [Salmonella enterica subsp. enterica serovar Kentucky]|nr:hypothetical protein [Salmonella enterica subsp. enterica serovar Kentucky]